jgi:hypothetical protein
MPDLWLQIASDTSLQEPMWGYLPDGRASLDASANDRAITGIRLVGPPLDRGSLTQAMARRRLIELATGGEYRMELEFDRGGAGKRVDLHPDLPVVIRL